MPLHVSSNKCSSSGGPTCINTSSCITHSGEWLMGRSDPLVARNMYRHEINTLRKSASSWSLTRIRSRCTVNKILKNVPFHSLGLFDAVWFIPIQQPFIFHLTVQITRTPVSIRRAKHLYLLQKTNSYVFWLLTKSNISVLTNITCTVAQHTFCTSCRAWRSLN